jgi:hypothetical protein
MRKAMYMLPLMLAMTLALAAMSAKPANGAESVYILIEFNTGTDESFTATVYGGSGCVSAAAPSQCGDSIAFNSSTGTTTWDAPERIGGSAQDATHPILIVTNTGNVALDFSTRTDADIGSVDACLDLRFAAEQEASCNTAVTGATANDLNDTATIVDASFAVADNQWCIWLWGNFTGCTAGIDDTYLYLNSTA